MSYRFLLPSQSFNLYRIARIDCLGSLYLRGADEVELKFINRYFCTVSLQRAKKWIEELQRQGDFKDINAGDPHLVMVLVANNADLDTKREVQIEEGKRYAMENGLQFFETSAKTGENINELFYEIAKRVVQAAPQNPT